MNIYLKSTLLQCPIDIRRTMAQNILVIGGTSMTPGFRARLLAELKDLLSSEEYSKKLPLGVALKFHKAPAKDNYASWLGGLYDYHIEKYMYLIHRSKLNASVKTIVSFLFSLN